MSEARNKSHRWMGIAGFILLGAGVVLDLLWMERAPSWFVYAINLVPGAQLLASWRLAVQYPERRTGLARFGVPLAVVALIFAVVLNVIVDFATSFITDLDAYPRVVAEFEDPALVAHFPADIPEESRSREFFAVSAFLRRARVIQLRVELPEEQINALLAQYQAEAAYTFWGGDASEHSALPDSVPTTYFYTSGGDTYVFPESYQVLVLDAQPETQSADGFWRHGYSYGVAISEAESEIVYWLEAW